MVQQDYAIGDVFFQSVPGQRDVVSALRGNDSREFAIVQPGKQPAELRSQYRRVGQTGKQRLDAIQHNALRFYRVDRVAQTDEQALDVVFSSLFNLISLNANMVHRQLLAFDKLTQ